MSYSLPDVLASFARQSKARTARSCRSEKPTNSRGVRAVSRPNCQRAASASMGCEKAIVKRIFLGDPLGPLEETGAGHQPDPQAGRAIVLVKLLDDFFRRRA